MPGLGRVGQGRRRLTWAGTRRDDLEMTDDNALDPREAERVRRRDREAEAEQRALLKPGMGKVFKQIQDSQRKAAADVAPRGSAGSRKRRGP